MVAVHRGGQRYIHVHRRQCTVSCLEGWEGGSLSALWDVMRQMHTTRRMVVIYTTLGIVGYLLIWKYSCFISGTENRILGPKCSKIVWRQHAAPCWFLSRSKPHTWQLKRQFIHPCSLKLCLIKFVNQRKANKEGPLIAFLWPKKGKKKIVYYGQLIGWHTEYQNWHLWRCLTWAFNLSFPGNAKLI